ncbi:dual specificity calcium/calmodulin-dependent 3',5'-cyclic nucleotide phosphodiesterase 1A-like [Ahaetulla prasina]|uniref:dual specificity calcium/calmodulin-dependent 3',5'-cyclic nucleotide phosphodiesterase 1A-like n=1 Tax=Ahaetulla prasina TaxID=499056 RepID=UPI0026484373|nr:dual specificity calcium/calmodulin-dependent 3',5'-cyclic nucleotide phosphodiesterase 1A-like [Ahaetulla prasina]
MTQDKREKIGIKTNTSQAKTKTCDQRTKKKLSATLLSLLDTEDELSSIRWDSVPMDVKEWLTDTFAKKKEAYRLQPDEITSIRSISYALENGVVVEREFRTATSSVGMAYELEVIQVMKTIDKWDFNVFTLDEAAEGHCLRFMICEIFSKYDLLKRFQIPLTILISFAKALEAGYSKHKNPYHNSLHAADVTQTVHAIMIHTGMMQWFTDLEILAIFFSSSIHDYEHTGTTNHFHIETRSKAALLYNDRSVLENHHVSAAFRLLQDRDTNILGNLTKDEWRELRRMVINIVLSTDMSHHFQQMKVMKHILQCFQLADRTNKDKIMSFLVHVADISHPAKPWELHHRWSEALLEEFFEQGDKEAEMGLPISSLCDRKTTNIAESQIGFIDIIVKPAFVLLLETVEKPSTPVTSEAANSLCEKDRKGQSMENNEVNPSGNGLPKDYGICLEKQDLNLPGFRDQILHNIEANRNKWKDNKEAVNKGEPLDKESNKAKKQVTVKAKGQQGKQKTTKEKPQLSSPKDYCTAAQNPSTCRCQLCISKAFEPMEVSFIIYNANSSELSQPQQETEVMDVTESYEEIADKESSWRKATCQNIDESMQEMRNMVPKTKVLHPDESDDVIIEEFVPNDPEPPKTTKPPDDITPMDCQQLPNLGFLRTNLTKSDLEIFSLWNEEVMRRAADQQKKKLTDTTVQVAAQLVQNEQCQRSGKAPAQNPETFILQVISVDSPSATCQDHTPYQQDVASTPAPTNAPVPASNVSQANEPNPCGAAAVSVTSLSYGVFKIP